MEEKIIQCSVCHRLFASEGLKSCPAHSFGDEYTKDEWEQKPEFERPVLHSPIF